MGSALVSALGQKRESACFLEAVATLPSARILAAEFLKSLASVCGACAHWRSGTQAMLVTIALGRRRARP
jgi:hypothetical protein